jgi:neurofibromin 1
MILFFVTIYQNVSNLVTTTGQVMITPQATQLIEQSIVCMKKMLESLPHHSFSHLTNLEQLLEMCAKYINQLVLSERALRIKMKFCTLIDTVMEYRSQITFKNPAGWRMFLVETILGWMSDYVDLSKEQFVTQGEEVDKLKVLFAEVDVHCMRTCATLFRGLSFEAAPEKTTTLVTTPTEMNPPLDQNAVVKYFTFFEKVLARCRKERETTQRDNTKRALVKYTILALSHLLSANINSALQYFAAMGYHENPGNICFSLSLSLSVCVCVCMFYCWLVACILN